MLVLASVTDSIVTFATHVINHLGLPGIFLLVAADALGIPIAAAAIMLFAGFDVSEGHHSVVSVVVAGVLGDVVGASIAYAIGAWGGQELAERHGGKIHLTPERIAIAHRWFERWGAPAVFVGRNVPVVRTYMGYPAGVARMPYRIFLAATTGGAIVLCVVWTLVGKSVGSRWTDIRHYLGYVDYAVVVIVVAAIVYFLLHRARARRQDDTDGGPGSGGHMAPSPPPNAPA